MSLPPRIPEPTNRPEAQPATADHLREVQKEMTSYERSTLRWAGVAVLMSALAALFICLQWYEMHASSADTRSLAIAAGNQANAAVVQALLTKAQVDKMGQSLGIAERTLASLEVQQRAWVALEVPPRLEPSENSVTWAVENFGKSPAYRVEAVPELVNQFTDVRAAQNTACSKIGAAHTSHTGEFSELLFPRQVGNHRKAFARGQEIIYFVGCIRYADPFNDNRWTKFCYQPSPREPGKLVSCFAYNSTDADQQSKLQKPD